MKKTKVQNPKDVYPFIIDCSLDKQGNILIYELQPLVSSGLGQASSRLIPAFEKGFPGLSFTLDYKATQYPPKKPAVTKVFFSDIPFQENSKYQPVRIPKYSKGNFQFPYKKPSDKEKYAYTAKKSVENLQFREKQTKKQSLITLNASLHRNQDNNFNSYSYVHVPNQSTIERLNNKINQRLYLPTEVSPPYLLFDRSKDRDKELAKLISYFKEQKIEQIVLKHPEDCMGNGNVFIDSIQNEDAIKQGIDKLSNNDSIDNLRYLLVESQSALPRISRKTGAVKSGYATYRIVGIAKKNGTLGYFIASKSISSGVDSHQRNIFKFYLDGETKVDPDQTNCITQHCKPKDKYFNLGTDKIPIDSKILSKIFESAYRLYRDSQTMTPREFEAHIDSLILKKENGDLKRENNGPNIEKPKTKGLYESFISQLKELNLKVKVKATIKQDKLNIYLLTSQSKLPLEISLFLEKIDLKNKDITIEKYSSPSDFFSTRNRIIKMILPNSLSSYQILIETLKETKAEITKELTSEQAVVDSSHKL